jgi:2-oxoglutarate ferredoxin oxidoreductase subunit beta
MTAKEYLRQRFFPQIWCPGCGHGIVMGNMIRAIDQLGLEKNEVVVVSGIGCLMVIVPMGDGDAAAIGGNHFIHAARRNIDLTAIIMNNSIYGMTGGQFSPMTPFGDKSTTAPSGTIDHAFDLVELAKGAGASFVARTTTYHVKEMIKIIVKAITHKGFSMVEVLSQCPTYYGRKNKLGSAVDMMNRFKMGTTSIGSKKKTEHPELIERGIFLEEERTEYSAAYLEVIQKSRR